MTPMGKAREAYARADRITHPNPVERAVYAYLQAIAEDAETVALAKEKAERFAMRANRPTNALKIEMKAYRKGFLAALLTLSTISGGDKG